MNEIIWISPRSRVSVKSLRRNLLSAILLGAMLLALCFPAEAQQRAKVYRIGYLGGGPGIDEREETLRQALKELGYVEGQNIFIEWRFAKGDESRLPELAAELGRLKPDVIVTTGTQPARALKDSTTTILSSWPVLAIWLDGDWWRALLGQVKTSQARQVSPRT